MGRQPEPQYAPPPYQMGNAPNQTPAMQQPYAQYQPGPSMQIQRQFPSGFSMYRESAFNKSYMIGVHQNQPLYAVSCHTGWSSKPAVILHSGPNESMPPLAAVDSSPYSTTATMILPPLPGTGSTEERMESSRGFGFPSHMFSVEVGPNNQRERFEWRHSRGAEVDSLGGLRRGWKLVRLDSNVRNGGQFAVGGARTRDGDEVVAVWANVGMTLSKSFNFRFLGNGDNGSMGERWAVMAVISALRIWDKERKSRSSAA